MSIITQTQDLMPKSMKQNPNIRQIIKRKPGKLKKFLGRIKWRLGQVFETALTLLVHIKEIKQRTLNDGRDHSLVRDLCVGPHCKDSHPIFYLEEAHWLRDFNCEYLFLVYSDSGGRTYKDLHSGTQPRA
jgi:hypothetical protein